MAMVQVGWRRPSGLAEGRVFHIIDVENLMGTGRPSEAEVESVLDLYRRMMGTGPCDQVVIAANGPTAAVAGWAWPGVLVRTARGADGADRALLGEIDVADLAGRFDKVVIASGDHAFAMAAHELRSAGLSVEVISRPGALSAQLRDAATTVRHLPLMKTAPASAA